MPDANRTATQVQSIVYIPKCAISPLSASVIGCKDISLFLSLFSLGWYISFPKQPIQNTFVIGWWMCESTQLE